MNMLRISVLIGFLACTGDLVAEDKKPAVAEVKHGKATPIPDGRKAELYQAMIAIQSARIDHDATEKANNEAMNSAQAKYAAVVNKFRNEFNGVGCEIQTDATWNCADDKAANPTAKPETPAKPAK